MRVGQSGSYVAPNELVYRVPDYAVAGIQRASVANGLSKPLSTFYGTLGAAQADYPAATSLTDELDAVVILKAIAASGSAPRAESFLPPDHSYVGTVPWVDFGWGHYIINKELPWETNYAFGGSRSRATIEQIDDTKRIFVNEDNAYQVDIEGLSLIGGTVHYDYANNNTDWCVVRFSRCEFTNNHDDFAFKFRPLAPATTMSVTVIFEDSCKFGRLYQLISTTMGCDVLRMGGWCAVTSNMAEDAPYIVNRGWMCLEHLYLGFGAADFTTGDRRIVDNYGQIKFRDVRIGGEGGGMAPVWQYGGPQTVYPYVFGSTVEFEDCWLYTGLNNPTNNALVKLVEGIPQRLSVKGNFTWDHVNHPIVTADAGFDVAAYINALPALPNSPRCLVDIDPDNLVWNPLEFFPEDTNVVAALLNTDRAKVRMIHREFWLKPRAAAGEWQFVEGDRSATRTLVYGRMTAAPFRATLSMVVQAIATEVTSAGDAGSLLRFGVYADDRGWPGGLIADFGTVAADSLGIKKKTGLATRLSGLVWLVVVAQNGAVSPVIRATTTPVNLGEATMADSVLLFSVMAPFPYDPSNAAGGALPATFPGSRGVGLDTTAGALALQWT